MTFLALRSCGRAKNRAHDPERLDRLPERLVAGQDQEALRLELPGQPLPVGQPNHPVVACQHGSLRS
jgi:hypothetical protein